MNLLIITWIQNKQVNTYRQTEKHEGNRAEREKSYTTNNRYYSNKNKNRNS